MKRWVMVGIALSIAACAGSKVPPPNTARAHYERSVGAIRVLVSNIRPMSDAELIGPDGKQYRAAGVVLLEGPHVAYNPPPSIGFGIGGFGFTGCCSGIGSGVGLGLPLGGPTPAEISDQFLTSASIPVPADYPTNWASYKLRIQLGDSAMLLNAPAPT